MAARIAFGILLLVLVGCSGGSGGSSADPDGGVVENNPNNPSNNPSNNPVVPVVVAAGAYTYSLDEGSDSLPLWTTPIAHKVQTSERAPTETGTGLKLSAAREEHESVQLVVGPGTGAVTVAVAPFPSLGADQRLELAEVGYESGWSEHLTPLDSGGSVTLRSDAGVPITINVWVPADAPAGLHETSLTLTHGGSTTTVPVELTVFDFSIGGEIHFATQMNVSVSSLVPPGGDVDDAKQTLFDLRFTPKSVAWPSGFGWGITWENGDSPNRCEALWDEPDEPDQYSIGWLAPRYMLGEGWNGVGFPHSMVFQFVDNGTPRPGTFCDIPRGDHAGSAAYNAEWSQFLGATEGYLRSHGMLEKAYYYVQNEPQNDADHELAAHLCRLTKAAAPDLRIAVSEEPKPEIAEDSGGACGYDIWIAHIRAYQKEYAFSRQQNHGEAVWFYSLDQDPDPYFNPTKVDNQGLHQRIIPWVSWGYRVTGFAYYDAGRWFDGHRPGMRAVLLREGFEDYEYLYLANGGRHPSVGSATTVDETAASVASSLTSWTKDPDALMTLRHELGRYIEGSRDTLPVLEVESDVRPREAYFINFQDRGGEPSADPLTIEGDTYIKVGWDAYDAEVGYGWSGEYVGNSGITLTGYDDVGGFSEAEKSYLYDDYGRDNLFEFALPNGAYEVTVGVGRPQRGYPGDPHNVTLEGTKIVDDEVTTDAAPTIARTTRVELADGSLSMEAGGRSEASGDWAYTFVAYLKIVPVD